MLTTNRVSSMIVFAKSHNAKVTKVAGKLLALLVALAVIAVSYIDRPVQAQQQFAVIATVDVTVSPFGASAAPGGATIWVANSGSPFVNANTVTVIDANTFAIQSVITVGQFPEDIAFARAGSQAFVTNSSDATVSVINTSTRSVTQTVSLAPVPMRFPFGIVATTDGSKVFVTSAGAQIDTSLDNIAILNNSNPANVTLDGSIRVVGATGRSALTPDGSLLVVTRGRGHFGPPEVVLIDPVTNAIVDDLVLHPNTGATMDVAVTPDGRFAYAGIFGGSGGVWVIDLTNRTTVTVIPTPDKRIHGIGISPDGRFVFATNFILGTVSVISTALNQVVATLPVGALPNEVAVTPDSTKAFVTNQGDTTVSVISIPGS